VIDRFGFIIERPHAITSGNRESHATTAIRSLSNPAEP
jgi:hypothetical protein